MGDSLVSVFPSGTALAEAAALRFLELAQAAIDERGRFMVALSGGSTPKALYTLLSDRYPGKLDWSKVHLFWGDERYVPLTDPLSCYKMAEETGILGLGAPAHPWPVHLAHQEAAAAFEAELLTLFGGEPVFDLVLLGMGPDGHCASLFPGTPAPAERAKRVLALEQQNKEVPLRLTLTLPVITGARAILFLVTGADKRTVLHDVIERPTAVADQYPAALVQQAGRAHWFVDQAAWG
ncbi:MAG TPA: 6-phosphogluconolactonase [Symbiobacteriaceae bacterium]|nr:6-phosphogluconolactonase [Symbiobacteriaceae bacterium]